MAKPTSIPRWTDVTAGNRTEPTSGKKDSGWITDERPAAAHMNWNFYAIYLWVQYLSALLGGSGVSEVLVAGGATLSGSATVGGTLGVTGATTIGGSATVTGAVIANAGVAVSGNVIISSGGALTVAAGATVGGAVTATGAVIGSDLRNTSIRRRSAAACVGSESFGTNDWQTQAGMVRATTASPNSFRIPLDVEEGEIVNIFIEVQHSTATAAAMSATAQRWDGAFPGSTIGSAASSSATTALQTLLLASSVTVGAYGIAVNVSAGGGGAMNRDIFRVIVEYVR